MSQSRIVAVTALLIAAVSALGRVSYYKDTRKDTWYFDHQTQSGAGDATIWCVGGCTPGGSQIEIGKDDAYASFPMNARESRLNGSPIPQYRYDPAVYVKVTVAATGKSGVFRIADAGPALGTGHVLDLTPAAAASLGLTGDDHFGNIHFRLLADTMRAPSSGSSGTPQHYAEDW
jgi:hypothetical protein